MRFLPRDEGEIRAQLQDERLQFLQNRSLQLAFRVLFGQAKEVEEIRIAEDEVGCQAIFVAQRVELARMSCSGFLLMAVRSLTSRLIWSCSVRVLHRSRRHISA